MTIDSGFVCDYCGQTNGWLRNSCKKCGWSKHVQSGRRAGYPPCGALMAPTGTDPETGWYSWTCQGCGWVFADATQLGT